MRLMEPVFRRIVIVVASGLILTAGIVFAASRTETRHPQIEVIEETEETLPEEVVPSRAERVIKALAAAYPQRIEKHEFRSDDWALLMDGVWYYFAEGKMLPEEKLEQADSYSGSFIIYNYQSELPPWTEPSPEQQARYRDRNRGGRRNDNGETPRVQRLRSHYFFEGLWQAANRDESSRRLKTVEFFGFKLTVHSSIVEVLSLVEKRIKAAAETDTQVRSWVDGLGEVHGWSWRNVSGSQSRSYHSYGIAVDLLPASLNGKETYWQWAAQRGREWWNIPYEERYHPPDAVIKAFEDYGFIWGGKWTVFDTMHFEYRPEVFILNGIELHQVQTEFSIP